MEAETRWSGSSSLALISAAISSATRVVIRSWVESMGFGEAKATI